MSALQTFDFESNAVRVILRDELPWFVAADVCRALGIENHRDAVARLDDDEKGVGLTDTLGGAQEVIVVSESGLYTLVLRSRDAMKAGTVQHRFRKWVTAEVLPAIRLTGRYEAAPAVSRGDARAWGQPLAKINTVASLMRAVYSAFGPEAARELYNSEPDMPCLRALTVGQIAGSPRDDAIGCIRHLMRAATGNGISMWTRYTLAQHDKAAERSLAEFGLGIGHAPHKDTLYVASVHPFLNELFEDTQWAGAWKEALQSLPGVVPLRYVIQFGKIRSKALAIPMSVIHKIKFPWDS